MPAPQPGTKAAHGATHSRAFHWLIHLGAPGVFCLAIIDSSPIPLPVPGTTDLLLLWLASHGGNPWILAPSAIAGGLLGGYLGWGAGHKGGEEALKRRVSPRLLEPVRRWAKGNPFLSVFLPALMPPPVPLSPFVLASGALGVPLNRFLVAFGLARAIRYSLVTWLGATYGRHVIRAWSTTLDKWAVPLLSGFGALLAIGIAIAVIRARRAPKEAESEPAHETAAD